MIGRPPSFTLFPTTPLFRSHCDDPCPCCDSIGVFPADTTCTHCLAEALAVVGYTAGFCHSCAAVLTVDRKSTRLNSSHANISYAVFCLKKKKKHVSHINTNI